MLLPVIFATHIFSFRFGVWVVFRAQVRAGLRVSHRVGLRVGLRLRKLSILMLAR